MNSKEFPQRSAGIWTLGILLSIQTSKLCRQQQVSSPFKEFEIPFRKSALYSSSNVSFYLSLIFSDHRIRLLYRSLYAQEDRLWNRNSTVNMNWLWDRVSSVHNSDDQKKVSRKLIGCLCLFLPSQLEWFDDDYKSMFFFLFLLFCVVVVLCIRNFVNSENKDKYTGYI